MAHKLRIALFHNLPSGGAKRHTYEQVRELARRGHEIVEFTLSTADLSFFSLANHVQGQRVYPVQSGLQSRRRIPLVTPYINAILGILALRQLDTVSREIAHEIDELGVDLALVKDCQIAMNPYVLRHLETPSIFQCHHGLRHRLEVHRNAPQQRSFYQKLKDYYFWPAQNLYHTKFERDEIQNIRSSTSVLTNSYFSATLIQESYRVNSQVIYPGIDTNVFRPIPIKKANYVLGVGSLIYTKGYRFIISALAKVNKAYRPMLFIAANSKNAQEESIIKELAAEAGVALRIEQILDDQRLVEVYNQAQLLVYAPIQEALGMAPLEVMACGTPVIAVGEGGVCETVPDGLAGFLVARDAQAFADKLELLLHNDSLREQMGRAGIAHVRSNWSWTHAVDKLEAVLQATADTFRK